MQRETHHKTLVLRLRTNACVGSTIINYVTVSVYTWAATATATTTRDESMTKPEWQLDAICFRLRCKSAPYQLWTEDKVQLDPDTLMKYVWEVYNMLCYAVLCCAICYATI